MNAVDKARQQARKAQESMYDGACTVIEYQKIKDSVTHVTSTQPVAVLQDQPCRLSYSSFPSASSSDTADTLSQAIKLIIAPEINIKAGSKIEVTQNGRTVTYKNSGQPAVYSTHQEISLELYEEHP